MPLTWDRSKALPVCNGGNPRVGSKGGWCYRSHGVMVTGESKCSSLTLYTSFSQASTNQGTRDISEYSLRQVEDSLCVHFFRKIAAVLQCFIKEYHGRLPST